MAPRHATPSARDSPSEASLAHPLARFALNLVDADLPGGIWCSECLIHTNHDGAAHRAAAAELPEEA